VLEFGDWKFDKIWAKKESGVCGFDKDSIKQA
jgi:hypothetical protein